MDKRGTFYKSYIYKLYILYTVFNLITYYIVSYIVSNRMSSSKDNVLVYDIEDIIKTGNAFKEKLNALIELSQYGGGKLGIYNNKLYTSWNWFQFVQRNIYGESREKLIEFLTVVFDDYDVYVKMINTCINFKHHIKVIGDIKEEHLTLLKKWIKGITILKEQYKDDKAVVDELTKIEKKYTVN